MHTHTHGGGRVLHHMCTTSHVHYITCTTSHVHYITCALHHMCTTSHVHYITCVLHHMCTTSHVHYITHASQHANMLTNYRANLRLVRDFGDQLSQGKTIGNLANTYYLLGNFKKAIKYHEEVC